MNRSFKVVFNKVRGGLMVVNELTKSARKKGVKTVIAATAITLSASVFAQNTNEVNKQTYNEDQIFNETLQFDQIREYEVIGEKRPSLTVNTTNQSAIDFKGNERAYKVQFYGFKEMTLHSVGAAAIHQESLGTGGHLFLGAKGYRLTDNSGDDPNGMHFKQADALDKLTLSSEGSAVIYSKATKSNDEDHGMGRIGLYAKDILITQTGITGEDDKTKSAIYLTGEVTQNGQDSLGSSLRVYYGDKTGNTPGLQESTFTVRSDNRSIYVDNGGTVEIEQGSVDILGSMEFTETASIAMGWISMKDYIPESWKEDMGVDDNDSDTNLINKVTLKGSKTVKDMATIKLTNGAGFYVNAKEVDIEKGDAEGSSAIFIQTSPSKEMKDSKGNSIPAVFAVNATESLNIVGDITLDVTQGWDERGVIKISSQGALSIKGNIQTINTKRNAEGLSQNILNLTLNEGQIFEGSITDKWVDAVNPDSEVSEIALMALAEEGTETTTPDKTAGTYVSIKEGGTLKLTGDSQISGIESNGGTIQAQDGKVTITQLKNTGKTTIDVGSIAQGKVEIAAQMGSGDLTVKGKTQGNQSAATLAGAVKFVSESEINGNDTATEGDSKGYKVEAVESSGSTGSVVTVDKNGVISDFVASDNTTVAESLNDVAGVQVLAWRAQINDVNKRLGDLRTYHRTSGSWARVFGGESKFGERDLKNKFTTVQAGFDTRVGGDFYVGATASYTDGNGRVQNGSTEDKTYSFGLYGGWLGEDGQFLDVILKEAKMKTDFDLSYVDGARSAGNFGMWGTSVAAEYGWRFALRDNFWVEPQAEVTYGFLNGVNYTSDDGVAAQQKKFESLVARLGIAVGKTFTEGSAYLKASVAHDFDAKAEIAMSNGLNTMQEDLGGTWGEIAMGGTVKIDGNFHLYGELQTSFGSPVDTPYQWNLGVRYTY